MHIMIILFFGKQLFSIYTKYCGYINYHRHANFFFSIRIHAKLMIWWWIIARKLGRYRWLSNSGKFADALIMAVVYATINGIKREVKEIFALQGTTGGLKLLSDGVLPASVSRLDGWEINPLIFLVDTFSRQRSAWLTSISTISRQNIKFNTSFNLV